MKRIWVLCLSCILLLAIPVSGYAENAFLGESGKVFEGVGGMGRLGTLYES